jgi:hypothetical protein
MLSLKSILNESPDAISIPAMHGGSDDPDDLDLIEFGDANFTFLVYPDKQDNKNQWVAFDYINNKIISSSPGLQDVLYGEGGSYSDDDIQTSLGVMLSFPSHYAIREILDMTDRYGKDNARSILDGRLFERAGNWYFPFWQLDLNVLLKKNKSLIDDFLRTINVRSDKVYFEDERDERVFHSYDETFSSVERPTSSDEQRRMKQMQQDLHVNKGKLDKAIVQALQSRPKDVNTLYQRLEKQFGMPVAKIKHLYGAIPLDKLIAKKAKELNENNGTVSKKDSLKKSVDDNKRMKLAQVFFKSKLGIKDLNVKVVLTSLVATDEGQLKYTHVNGVYGNFVIEIDNTIDVDKKVRALAHELIHVEQLHTGMLDYVNRMWNGQLFDKEIYWKRPWESDARVRSTNLWIEFNRAKRDGKL